MSHSPVVISCFGAITPIGDSHRSISESLFQARSGLRPIRKFSTSSFRTKSAGIPVLGNERLTWPRESPVVGEELYALEAVKRLVDHEQFPRDFYSPDRIGCFIGTDEPTIDISSFFRWAEENAKSGNGASSLAHHIQDRLLIKDYLKYDPTITLRSIHKSLPFSGPSWCHMGLCSASLQAIGAGLQAVRSGRIDAAIVGGVSAKVVPTHLALLEAVGVIALNEELQGERSSRPFDSRRNGYVPAEGAALFLIERRDRVENSGRKPLLELCGYAATLNGQHIVKPHSSEREMIGAMAGAIQDAGIDPSEIEYINAHGTSTVLNDFHEARAINALFPRQIGVTANKSLHGHLIAAAGAAEVLNTLVACQDGFIPPTANLDTQDPACEVRVVTSPERYERGYILKNSFGMGGLASSILLKG